MSLAHNRREFRGITLGGLHGGRFPLSQRAFSDRQRAAFLTANNAAMFGLLTADVLKYPEPKFWILPMVVGVALLGCALAAARWLEDQSLSRKSYLTQGLVLVTLGLMTMEMSDSIRGPILAAESVVLLFMAIRRDNFIIQIGALSCQRSQ